MFNRSAAFSKIVWSRGSLATIASRNTLSLKPLLSFIPPKVEKSQSRRPQLRIFGGKEDCRIAMIEKQKFDAGEKKDIYSFLE